MHSNNSISHWNNTNDDENEGKTRDELLPYFCTRKSQSEHFELEQIAKWYEITYCCQKQLRENVRYHSAEEIYEKMHGDMKDDLNLFIKGDILNVQVHPQWMVALAAKSKTNKKKNSRNKSKKRPNSNTSSPLSKKRRLNKNPAASYSHLDDICSPELNTECNHNNNNCACQSNEIEPEKTNQDLLFEGLALNINNFHYLSLKDKQVIYMAEMQRGGIELITKRHMSRFLKLIGEPQRDGSIFCFRLNDKKKKDKWSGIVSQKGKGMGYGIIDDSSSNFMTKFANIFNKLSENKRKAISDAIERIKSDKSLQRNGMSRDIKAKPKKILNLDGIVCCGEEGCVALIDAIKDCYYRDNDGESDLYCCSLYEMVEKLTRKCDDSDGSDDEENQDDDLYCDTNPV